MEHDFDYWKTLISISAFLILILWDLAWDIIKSCRKDVYWVPSKVCVLSGLTLLLLGYLFGERKDQELQELFQKQLSTDVSRFILCVFVAYVLPSMALHNSGQQWLSCAALVISLSYHIATEVYSFENLNNNKAISLSFHISTEIYSYENLNNVKASNQEGGWFISSSITLSVAAICLVLYLGMSVLWGNILHEDLNGRILKVFSEIKLRNEIDYYRLKIFEDEILKLWFLAQAWEGQYVLGSSELSPGAAGILTICMAILVAKVACNASLFLDVVGLPFFLQCLFIFIGFVVNFLRLAVFVRSPRPGYFVLDIIGSVLMFMWVYMGPLLHPIYLLNEQDCKYIPRPILTIFKIVSSTILVIIVLPPMIFLALLVLFNYFWWLLFIWVLRFKEEPIHYNDPEFWKYKSLLEKITTEIEYENYIWKSNLRSFEEVKNSMQAACSTTKSSEELLKRIGRSVTENLPRLKGRELEEFIAQKHPRLKGRDLKKHKQNAVMAIEMIVDLRDMFGWDLDICDVEELIEAYEQAKDLLEFAACPDNINIGLWNLFSGGRLGSFVYNFEMDQTLLKVKKTLEIGKQPSYTAQLASVLEYVQSCDDKMGIDIWMYKVIADGSYENERELVSAVVSLVEDIMACCVLQLPDLIMKCCKLWTREFQEDKIKRACEIAAKVDAIIDIKYNPGTETQGRENRDEEIQIYLG